MRTLLGLILLLAALVQLSAPGNATPLCAGNNACSPTDNSVDTSASSSSAATAHGGSATNTNVNAPVTVNTNTNTAHGGKGGDADADATAVNFNANVAKGGNVSNAGNSSNTNRNKNTNTATSDQTQKQGQAQLQGQNQGQVQGQSVDGSGNSHVSINNPRQPVNSAIAAALTSSNETCMGSTSIGGQGVGFGISIGSTWENEACERRRNASVLFALGLRTEAIALMCQDETVAAAFEKTGLSCVPAHKTAEAPAFVPMAPIPND